MNTKQLVGILGLVAVVVGGGMFLGSGHEAANQRFDAQEATAVSQQVAPPADPGSNQAFCGGVLKAVAIAQESYAPGLSRQNDDFARDYIDRAANKGLPDASINYFFSQGVKQMQKDQAKKDSDEAFNLMQECLRLPN